MKLYTDTETYDLDPHQRTALNFLFDQPRAALFLEMALQKTITTLLYLDAQILAGNINRVLVVAPLNVARLTWVDELKKWHNLKHLRFELIAGDENKRKQILARDADIYIINIDLLTWLIDQYVYKRVSRNGVEYGSWLGSLPFDCLVIDESSTLKNPSSNRFKVLRRALKLSSIQYRIILAGTPSPNGLVDLWSQYYILDDGRRLYDTYGEFEARFFNTYGNKMYKVKVEPKKGAKDEILRRVKSITLTMKTDEHIKLPPIKLIDELIEFDAFDGEMYELLENEYFIETEDVEILSKTAADLVGKLQQITSGAIYDEDKVWHQINTTKFDRLAELLKDPDPILIVYAYRHEVDRLVERFDDITILPDGNGARSVFEAWNRGEVKRLVIHPASAGHGLNLQHGGSKIIWLTPTYNLEHWEQTLARLKRRGQKADCVTVHRLIIKNTIDEKIANRIKEKASDQAYIFKTLKAWRTTKAKNIFG